jgi:hypothetical protein
MPAGASPGLPRLRTIPTATDGIRPRFVPAWSTPRGEAAREDRDSGRSCLDGFRSGRVRTTRPRRIPRIPPASPLRIPRRAEPGSTDRSIVAPRDRAQSCSTEILIAAHIAMPAPVAPFVTETRRPAPCARTPLAAPAGTCGTRFAAARKPETASGKEVSWQSRPGPQRCRFIQ